MRWDSDPAYQAAKAQYQRDRPPCAICGEPIDYTSPRYRIAGGRRVENPAALDVDHVTPRATPGAGPVAFRPTHARCNRRRGANLGARLRQARTPRERPVTSRDWYGDAS